MFLGPKSPFEKGAVQNPKSRYFKPFEFFDETTIVYLTNSIIASVPVHIVGDLVFFTLIWPHDASRRLVTEGGADLWFWVHIAQAAIFTALTLLAFGRLARHSASERQSSPTAA